MIKIRILTSSTLLVYYSMRDLRKSITGYMRVASLFVPRPNSNFMNRTLFRYYFMECIIFKLQDSKKIDIFKKKYFKYLLLQQEHD
jgi:hypothetical protein